MRNSVKTSLLNPSQLTRVERLRLNSSRRFTSRMRGEHLAGRSGSSNEFSDYRDYVAGDDTRFVDWNVFARLRRPYMKLYREEDEMNVVLLIDASASMADEEKFDRARQLAACFGIMALFGGERLSAYCLRETGEPIAQWKPARGRGQAAKFAHFLEGLEPGGDAPLEHCIESALRYHRGRGMAIILSDFLTLGDLKQPFNRLFSQGLETMAVQILSARELAPELSGDARLVDCETDTTLDVSANAYLLELYHEHLAELQQTLSSLSKARGGRFLSLSSADSLERMLFDQVMRAGWIR